MWRIAAMRFVAFLFVVSVGATAWAQPGFIQVRAQPGIQVFMDDVFVGVTNADVGGSILTDVRVGQQRLQFVCEGFLPQDAAMSVAAGQVPLDEKGSLVPRLQVSQDGAGGAAELRVQMGTLVVQCLPMACVVDVPALGISNVRNTQDPLLARGVPVGSYTGRLSVGSSVLPVSCGVCADDTVTLFANFVGGSLGVASTSAANPAWPRCEPVRLRLIVDEPMVLLGERRALSVAVEGVEPSASVWSASAGSIQGSGADVVFVAPSSPGSVTVVVGSDDDTQWRNEVVLTGAPFVMKGFRPEPAGVVEGASASLVWSVVAPAGVVERYRCVLATEDGAGSREDVIDDCGRVTSVMVKVGAVGELSTRLRVSDGLNEVLAMVEVMVQQPPAPTSVVVSNVRQVPSEGDVHEIVLDLAWPESWRGPLRPSWVEASGNWDAVWVFVKYRMAGGDWRHATLRSKRGSAPAGVAVDITSDGMGAFVYRAGPGYGPFEAHDVRLLWDAAIDGVPPDAVVEVRPFAIEMVFVPQGSFGVGSGGSSAGEFRAGGSTNAPFVVSSQSSIALGDGPGQLMWTASTASGSASGSTHALFPTGFGAFYAMKYQVTQGQYVNFLNTLTQAQADARKHTGSANRYGITGSSVGSYATSSPYVAMNYASWADGAAFADWAGLRPLTELEFEKVGRGPLTPVANEYAWGSTSITQATGLARAGTITETPTPAGANAAYGNAPGVQGPVRPGAFAAPGRTRRDAGAGYYGVLELSGNLWERPLTVGNAEGRAFTGTHGDGVLDAGGDANGATWPGSAAVGAGFRGGCWPGSVVYLRVSSRNGAADTIASRNFYYGWRGARSAP